MIRSIQRDAAYSLFHPALIGGRREHLPLPQNPGNLCRGVVIHTKRKNTPDDAEQHRHTAVKSLGDLYLIDIVEQQHRQKKLEGQRVRLFEVHPVHKMRVAQKAAGSKQKKVGITAFSEMRKLSNTRHLGPEPFIQRHHFLEVCDADRQGRRPAGRRAERERFGQAAGLLECRQKAADH